MKVIKLVRDAGSITEVIEEVDVSCHDCYGDGSGSGDGDGRGRGYGYGWGYGDGYGYGYGE